MSFRQVKVGDQVRRRMGREGPIMVLKVTGLTDDFILCGALDANIGHDLVNFNGWTFDRDYGYEIDEELGWGVPRPDGKGGTEFMTGSCLISDHA